MNKKTIADIQWQDKRALVRVDFNVPMREGQITDDTRIRAALPTINTLLEQGASLVLMSHLGRPKGEPNPQYSLQPVAEHLANLLDTPVHFCETTVGPAAEEATTKLVPGNVLLLENTRFDPRETKNGTDMAQQLAKLGDIFVNDAFGSAHRAHASTTAILGGAKISDKIGVIHALLKKVDAILIGGGMANTFLAAQGHDMGNSLVEDEAIALAKELMNQDDGVIQLPVDLRVASEFSAEAEHQVVDADETPADWMALDIGPATIAHYANRLAGAKTIIWNGPMGVAELPPFAVGTNTIADILADLRDATTIIGGGDSAAAVKQAGLDDKMSHVSTGGGASLEFLEGKTLPGVAALDDRK